MEIKLYIRMLQRGWWIVALTIMVALIVALISAYFTIPIYHTSASFSVSPSSTLNISGQEALNSLEALDKRSIIQTYAEFLNSERIYKETLLSMNLIPEDMDGYTRSTVVIPDANILELSIEGPDPKLVALVANNTAQNAIQHIKQLYKVYDINILDPALIPTIPISPQPLRDAGVAALLGLIIGAALAITSEQLRVPLDSYRLRARLDPVSMVLNRQHLQQRLNEMIVRIPPEVSSFGLIGPDDLNDLITTLPESVVRSHLQQRLNEMTARNPIEEISFGLVRLNGLRDLIDTLPQSVVQQIMRQVAAVLQNELRGNDMVGRWNDTTFAFILPATHEIAAIRTMDRIRVVLEKPVYLVNYGETIHLDPYSSVASYQNGDTSGDVTKRAEDDLEHSHTTGNTSIISVD